MHRPTVHPIFSIHRRRLLQAGSLGCLGLSLEAALRAEAATARPRTGLRACILIFYYGGPSHLEMWDPKPEAPAEVRGTFQAIETRAPGIRISEHLPHSAKVMNRVALVRSVHHPMRNHNSAAAEALSGRTPPGGDQELLTDDARSFPHYASALSYAARDRECILPHVALPHVMRNLVVLPGQGPGFLGPAHDRFQVESDPSSPQFRVSDLELPASVTAARLEQRQTLLASVDRQARHTEKLAAARGLEAYSQRVFGLLSSEAVRQAFDLSREPAPTRDRYGRHRHGQSVLLARRLVEAGTRFVSVYDGIHNGQLANWDSHQDVFGRHRDHLLPPADQAFAALVEDLDTRGLLDSTLVIAMGEFGRTPKINSSGGRDHWPDCYSIALAGGGVRGGTVYGASDDWGAYPASDPVTPGDLAATLFWRFGVDPGSEIVDFTGRPHRIAAGNPLTRLF